MHIVKLLDIQCKIIKYLNGFLSIKERKKKEYKNSDFKSVPSTMRPYKDGENKTKMFVETF